MSENRPLVLSCLFDLHLHDWGSVGFPAEVDCGIEPDFFTLDPPPRKRRANLADDTWAVLRDAWHIEGDLTGDEAKRLCRKLFRYCLAVGHAPQYETDHRDSLAHDWPRVPIRKDRHGFEEIAALGERLAQLLDPRGDADRVLGDVLGGERRSLAVVRKVGGGSVTESDLIVEHSYFGSAAGKWEERALEESELRHPEWSVVTGDLYFNETIFLSHVPPAVWRYEMGGYPVLKKWLGYRDARRRDGAPLTLAELRHLRNMIHRLAALVTLWPALNEAYEKACADAWLIDELTGGVSAT